MNIALIGNPNCGKSTLFNYLTDSNEKVGNWAGVTTGVASKRCNHNPDWQLFDLPGIYSLAQANNEETVSRDFLDSAQCDVIINLVYAPNLERSLYLTTVLARRNKPIIVALNGIDTLKKSGITINYNKLSELLGILIVPISALKHTNIDKLLEALPHASKPKIQNFGKTSKETYSQINRIVSASTTVTKFVTLADKVDKLLLNKYLGIPIFCLIIFVMFTLSIQVCGHLVDSAFDSLYGVLYEVVFSSALPVAIKSLATQGLLLGIISVLKFIPQIIVLFTFLAILEDCGYMARIAYLLDHIFHSVGLSGKTSISLILGCGCTVPALLSARTIDSPHEKKASIFVTPFIPCSAKLPLFSLLCAKFFANNLLFAPCLYLMSIVVVYLSSAFLSLDNTDNSQFFVELPSLRGISVYNVYRELKQKLSGFLLKVGTVIVGATILMWFLSSFDLKFNYCDINNSILAHLGRLLTPLFRPIGIKDWRICVAFLSGICGKETIVSSLAMLSNGNVYTIFNPTSALIFCMLVMFSSPCVSALMTAKQELKSNKLFISCLLFQNLTAYGICYLVYNLSSIFTLLK